MRESDSPLSGQSRASSPDDQSPFEAGAADRNRTDYLPLTRGLRCHLRYVRHWVEARVLAPFLRLHRATCPLVHQPQHRTAWSPVAASNRLSEVAARRLSIWLTGQDW